MEEEETDFEKELGHIKLGILKQMVRGQMEVVGLYGEGERKTYREASDIVQTNRFLQLSVGSLAKDFGLEKEFNNYLYSQSLSEEVKTFLEEE
jgi:hypothetical protein